jgi:hypothetical protein
MEQIKKTSIKIGKSEPHSNSSNSISKELSSFQLNSIADQFKDESAIFSIYKTSKSRHLDINKLLKDQFCSIGIVEELSAGVTSYDATTDKTKGGVS